MHIYLQYSFSATWVIKNSSTIAEITVNISHCKMDNVNNLISWSVSETTVAIRIQQYDLCELFIYMSVNNVKLLSAAQQCLYDEYISPTTIERT
jgi:hypothetical protein